MNQYGATTDPSGTSPGDSPDNSLGSEESGQHGGPRVTAEQLRDIDRLRRSTSDRYIAGVAGGLGRYLDVDPTVIRVVLGVLTFFGGAGVLFYAVAWLVLPEEGQQQATVDLPPDVRRVVLLVVGVVALAAVLGTPFIGDNWGTNFPFPLVALALVAVALFATRGRRRADRVPPAPWGSVPTSPAPTPDPRGTTMSSTQSAPVEETRPIHAPGTEAGWMPPQNPPQHPAQGPPPAYLPPLPPRPRRTGMVLFWPTLALIAIALGTLGIFDVSATVSPSAYFALALAVTGVMLLVGAFVGRPGGLIALGLMTSLALGVASTIEATTDWETSGESMRAQPTSAQAVQDSYRVPNGSIDLDLTGVRDLAALDGRTIEVGLNAGDITVVLPRGLNAIVDADLRFVGNITIGSSSRGGFEQSLTRTLTGSTDPTAPTITLDIDARAAGIDVQQE